MHVIRRGLLALILTAPMVVAASAASAPASQAADAGTSCLDPGSGANVAGNTVGTFVCLTVDSNPVPPQPLSTGSDGNSPPLICWLEPQYGNTAQLEKAIAQEPDPALKSAWQTQYGAKNPPPKGSGWWWGVGCDPTNLLAATYRQQLWAEVGLTGLEPWEWEADDATPDNDQAITVAMLAEYAWEAATLDAPSGQMSPTYSGGVSTQTVGLPTYFWGQIGAADGPPVAQHTIVASVGPLRSELIAVPKSVTVTTTGATTGSSTVTCPVTDGRFGTADPDNTTIDSACSFTYTTPSTGVTVTMTTNWTVTWTQAGGAPGWPKQAQSLPETFGGINVQEIQTINNGGTAAPTS